MSHQEEAPKIVYKSPSAPDETLHLPLLPSRPHLCVGPSTLYHLPLFRAPLPAQENWSSLSGGIELFNNPLIIRSLITSLAIAAIVTWEAS